MPTEVDPAIQLASVLTAAGATLSAALIASVIELLKRVPVFGPWLDADREAGTAVVLSAALVSYAFFATTPNVDAFNGFAAFLAFVGIAGLATKAYDVAVTVKTSVSG